MKQAMALQIVLMGLAICLSAHAPQDAVLPDHVVIRAQLIHRVSAATAKPGSRVEMRVLDSEKDGELVLIEKDAKLTGRVVAATARTDFSPESRLQVVIERAEWRG